MTKNLAWLCGAVCCCAFPLAALAQEAELQSARDHVYSGRYAEAREALAEAEKALGDDDAAPHVVDYVLLHSRIEQAEGNWEAAKECLAAERYTNLNSPRLLARRAELALLTGDFNAAERLAASALEIENNPLAILVQADLFVETGRLKEADANYRDLVRYYNQAQPTDAETLLLVAKGSAHYARLNGSTQIFNFIVNTMCPDALADDEKFWPILHFSGMLFLEKYNQPDALSEFQAALAINPRSAELITAMSQAKMMKYEYEAAEELADEALTINARYPPALAILADVAFWRGDVDTALAFSQRGLDVNPRDQRLLARKAFCDILKNGWPAVDELEALCSQLESIADYKGDASREYQQILIDIAKHNPRPGYALAELGRLFESQRRYPQTEICFVWANRLLPKLPDPQTDLAELYLRIGRLKEGRELLEAASKADPYHVRVSNLRQVLDQLETYREITTEHFIVRVDGEQDGIFGEALAKYLEAIYPELTQALGYEPPEKTQIDVFHDGDGESAHAWFSARMTGLPWLHTIGASTGEVISLVSPTAMEKPFNWARVIRHEYIHILTLKQTQFGIPHWFTEAMAVKYESPVMPWQWQELLARRVPAGELFELKTLNDGFQRAKSSEDWQMAYCQSRLYLEFLEREFGPEVGLVMIDAYSRNLSTEDAVRKACGIEIADLEKSFREYLQQKVDDWGKATYASGTVDEWEERHEASPDDVDVQVNFAHALLESGSRARAMVLVEEILDKQPDHEGAILIQADAEIELTKLDAALAGLNRIWNPDAPSLPVLTRLAAIRTARDETETARELCDIGLKRWPDNVPLMKLALETSDDERRTQQLLETLSLYEFDDPAYPKRLCESAWKKHDYAGVIKYGTRVLHIDILDESIYPKLGESYRQLKNYAEAAEAFETAWHLDGENYGLGVKLAECYRDAGEHKKALITIDAVLKLAPDDAEAKSLRTELSGAGGKTK